ncbi:MFS transporter [Chloroflexota bacterium]
MRQLTIVEKPRFFYGWIIAIASFIIVLVIYGTYYSFGIFFEPVLTDFNWTRAATSGAFSLSFLVHGFQAIIAGRLNDRFGPRVVMTAYGFVLSLGYLLISRTETIWQLYLFYGVLIGTGMGSGMVPITSTINRWFIKRRGLITGIVLSGIGLGTILIPPTASWIITTYGWHTSYLIIGIITLVLINPAAQFLKRDPTQTRQVPYGEGELQEKDLKLEADSFNLEQAIRTKQMWILCTIFLFFGLCIQTILVHIVIHVTGLNISENMAASILGIIGGTSIIGRIILGSACDKIGSKLAIIIGFIFLSASLIWLLVAKEVWMIYLFAIVFGLAYGGLVPLVSLAPAELFGLQSHGVIMGIQAFTLTIGGAVGPILAGYIFDINGSYNLAFVILALSGISAIILTVFLRPINRKGDTSEPRRSTRFG